MARPECLFPLFCAITELPGVGPKNAALFEKLAGGRVRDLLLLAPSGVIDRRVRSSLAGVASGEVATVEAQIGAHHPAPRRGSRPYRIEARNAEIDFFMIFFHAQADYLRRIAPEGERRVISGKVELFDGRYQTPHPDHILPPHEAAQLPQFEPTYPLTAGLSLKVLRKVLAAAVARTPQLPEWLDAAHLARERWPAWAEAIKALHAPQSGQDVSPMAAARRRLAYDELLAHQLALALARAKMKRGAGARVQGDGALRRRVLEALPFTPTGAQSRALAEIEADMASPERMMRLLQGDVGAGKTLVAFLALLIAIESGGQGALMAPTEILARQHAAGLKEWAEAAGLRMEIVTGRDKGKAREKMLADVAAGEVNLLIGTHALFQKDVEFHDLRLAVIDEQHRFGVAQRMALASKGGAADVLLMTATPIPRTLALAQYGDMELSVLDEKPPGRKPISTRLVSIERLEEVVSGIKRAIADGARVYWVCPLVEESELIDLAAAEDRARALKQALSEEAVALVHGRMTPPEKDAAMARFVSGEAKLLVATTVIEVGVNVPEATIMVIERAERFGLAQLHQLRGRVGRGADASHCLLLFQAPLSEAARARLEIMRETEDGFRLAEEDLRLRGSGDLLGLKQSGAPDFQLVDPDAHLDLMRIAQDDARLVLTQDPDLTSARGEALRALLYLMDRDAAIQYLSVG